MARRRYYKEDKYEYAPPSYLNDDGLINSGEEYDDALLNYLKDKVEMSKNYLRSNRGWRVADTCMRILYGDEDILSIRGLSKLVVKKLRRQGREAIATQTNIEPNIKFNTRKKELEDDTKRLEELFQDWWITGELDSVVKGVGQWAGGSGTGTLFIWPEYDVTEDEIKIGTKVLDYKHCLPLYVPQNVDLMRKTYMVTAHLEEPIPNLHAQFPLHCDIIREDRTVPSWLSWGVKKARETWKGLVDRNKKRSSKVKDTFNASFPTADLFITFIRDNAINNSGKTIVMNIEVTGESYEVPSLFDSKTGEYTQVNTNVIEEVHNDISGETEKRNIYRNITPKECRLFPNGRQIVWTNYGIIYDGPKVWGDATFPFATFRMEKLEGEFLGLPVIIDGRSLEDSANRILRSIEDSITSKMRVPLAIHEKANKKILAILEKSGIYGLIGKIFKVDLQMLQTPIKELIAKEFFDVDKSAPELVKFLFEMQDYEVGTTDFSNAWKVKQIPAADTQEYYKQLSGALSVDQSREIERALFDVGKIWFSFVPQVYTVEKRLTIMGERAFDYQQVDYMPNSFLPKVSNDDSIPIWKRLREWLKNFSVYAVSTSLQERESMTRKLQLLQIMKAANVHLPGRFIYESFTREQNYKELETEFYEEQHKAAVEAAKLQIELQKLMEQGSPQNNILGDIIGAIQTGDVELLKKYMGGTETGRSEGRPLSNAQNPRLDTSKVDNSGVPRTTMTTS